MHKTPQKQANDPVLPGVDFQGKLHKSNPAPLKCRKCGEQLRVVFEDNKTTPTLLFCPKKCFYLDFDLAKKLENDLRKKDPDRKKIRRMVEQAFRKSAHTCPKCGGEVLIRLKGKKQETTFAQCKSCAYIIGQ